MSFEHIIYEKRDRIAYVTINRPQRLNALQPQTHDELSAAWDDFGADPDVWVAILTGAGDRAFSAGSDLRHAAEVAAEEGHHRRERHRGGYGGIAARFDLPKPVIAAVRGWAMGGGFELALACDLIVAADDAKFGLPEPKVGVYASGGGIHRLPRHIPLKKAMGMLLTGDPIDARTAAEWGLVNEVVPPEELMAAAERWARRVLQCAPLSVRATKQGAMAGLDWPLENALRRGYDAIDALNDSEDIIEGPRSFAEKRPPQWKGR